MTPTERLDVALVGAGRRGWAHLEMLLAMPELRVVGVCDADRARLDAAARRAGTDVVAETKVEALVRGCRPGFAVVSTLQDTMPALCCSLLEAGVAVLAEVPPAYEGPLIRRMIDTAARAGLPLGSIENYPRTPLERLKQQLIAAGAFGRVTRAEIGGSVGHKGHEIAVARHYLGIEARPVRARGRASGGTGFASGEGVPMPQRLSGLVEFDNGTEAAFELRAVDVTDRASLDRADLRSDFVAERGGCRNHQLYLVRDGVERPVPVERRTRTLDGIEVPESLCLAEVPDVVWSNPFADTPFPPASRREYLCRVDDQPQSWEIAIADAYRDMAEAVRRGRPPEYGVAHSLTDVRIRLAMIESARRGGEWVDWQEEPYPVEREIIRRGWLRWLLRQSWAQTALAWRTRLRGAA